MDFFLEMCYGKVRKRHAGHFFEALPFLIAVSRNDSFCGDAPFLQGLCSVSVLVTVSGQAVSGGVFRTEHFVLFQ